MSKPIVTALAFAAALLVASASSPAVAAVAPAATVAPPDLGGMDAAASLREWLKLSDDQVTKLKPVIETRVTKMDAALATVEDAEKPDVLGFVAEYGKIRKEFDAGVTGILTPDQNQQWGAFKTQLEKEMSDAAAHKQLTALTPALALTADQVTKLQPAMATAMQGKIDLLQKLGDGGRISMMDKVKAKKSMEGINSTLEKSMATIVSPDQLATYKSVMAKKKEDRKAKS